VGALVSYLVAGVLQPHHIESWFGLTQALTGREWVDLVVAISLICHVVITGGFFCLTTLLYEGLPEDRERSVDRFFTNINTVLVRQEGEHLHLDNRQRMLLGRMVAVGGLLIMAMMALPNPLWGRLVFLACGVTVFAVGAMLVFAISEVPAGHDSDDDDDDTDNARDIAWEDQL
jgi:hypothetical protein